MIEPMGSTRARQQGALLAAIAVAISACGGGQRTFEPAEMVDELNGAGAELKLGPVLTENADGRDVISVFVADPAGEGDLGAGTLLMLEDSEAAEAEFTRCDGTPSLICYRAANGVLRFEELLPAGQAQVDAAVRAIATVE